MNERTPLVPTIPLAPPRPRHPHNVVRRFCTVALGSSLIALVVVFLLPVAFLRDRPHRHRHHPSAALPSSISHKELQQILLQTPKEEKAQEWSRYYTAGPHLAGKNYSQAIWTQHKWEDFGIKADIVAYDVYINYPLGHRMALYENQKAKSKDPDAWKVRFEASLEEDVLEEDPTTGLENRIPTFHGYSASGNVTAQYVYVNYGTYQDFEDVVKANISLEGKIAVARYGGVFRGLKVKRAQELGMVSAKPRNGPLNCCSSSASRSLGSRDCGSPNSSLLTSMF